MCSHVSTTLKLVSAAAIMSWFLAMAQTAVAEEGGSFTSLYSYQVDYDVIDHVGGKVTGGSISGTRTVLRSSGAPFLEHSVSIATCIVYARTTEAGFDLEAPCTSTDRDGDSLFMVSERKAGDIQEGGGGVGHTSIVGGTGKYADITGNCTYTTEYLPNNQNVTIRECDWKR